MKSKFNFIFLFLLATFIFQRSAWSGYIPPKVISGSQQNQTIRIASYNVENLFDTKHDGGKNDFEFLPKNSPEKLNYCQKMGDKEKRDQCLAEDWNNHRYAVKLNQIRSVFSLIAPSMKPQIVGLVEVENETTVKQLASHLGYRGSVTTNSPDERGIDVALMYNESPSLQFVGAVAYRLDVREVGKLTRDILEVNFKVKTSRGFESLMVYVNHWPSQGAPVAARIAAAKKLAEITKAKQAAGHHIVILGDFNVIDADIPSPFNSLLQAGLSDVDSTFRKWAAEKKIDISKMPNGSYYFGRVGSDKFPPADQWNILDRFFISSSLMKSTSLQIDISSYRIFSHPALSTTFVFKSGPYAGRVVPGVPNRYDHASDTAQTAGFSDHFPILLDLHLN